MNPIVAIIQRFYYLLLEVAETRECLNATCLQDSHLKLHIYSEQTFFINQAKDGEASQQAFATCQM